MPRMQIPHTFHSRIGSRHSRHSRRDGMTLIELLVVVAIVTAMMAMLAAAIRPALKNRKTKEASRILNAALAQAQARATTTGRRVGVWLQGIDPLGDPDYNAATELYLAEEPLPYSGDLESSHALIQNQGNNVCWIAKAENTLFAMESREVEVGDRIKFNYRGPAFPIIAVNTIPSAGHQPKFVTPGDYVEVVFNLGGYPPPRGPVATNAFGGPLGNVNYNNSWDAFGGSTVSAPNRATFQIFRQPRRVGPAIDLPTGACVDLRSSGIQRIHEDFDGNGALDAGEDVNGNGFLDLVPWQSPQDGTAGDISTYDPTPGIDFGLRQSEGGNATAAVIFAPDGSVAAIVRNREHIHRAVHPSTSEWPLGQVRIPDTVHFLIGDLGKMEVAATMPYITGGTPEPVNINENLLDPASLWVSVSVRSGNVTTANNEWVNLGVFSQSLHAARRFANEAQNLGAR